MRNLKKVYSTTALAEAGAFIRMTEIHEEMAFLKARMNGYDQRSGTERRKSKPVVNDGNGIEKKMQKPKAARASGPVPGVKLWRRAEEVVRENGGRRMTPDDVLAVLLREGWTFHNGREQHAVQAALRKTRLRRAKAGDYKAARVVYFV